MRELAQKLSLPRSLVFQNQNGHHALNFGATKKFQKSQKTRKIFQLGCLIQVFALRQAIFELSKTWNRVSFLPPKWSGKNLPKSFRLGDGKQTQFRVFDNNLKTVCLRAKTCIKHPNWNIFFIFWDFWIFFVAPKLRLWWPFLV